MARSKIEALGASISGPIQSGKYYIESLIQVDLGSKGRVAGYMSGRICPDCGREMHRSHRSALERLMHTAAFRCQHCGGRERVSRWQRLKSARYVRCPRCGRRDLRVLTRRDHVDFFNRSPFRILQSLVGARLYHCWSCRLQFYDLRKRTPDQEPEKSNGASGGSTGSAASADRLASHSQTQNS